MLHFAGSALLPCGIVSLIRERAAAAAHGSWLESETPQRCHGGCHWVCIEPMFSQYEPCTVFTIVHASPLPSTQVALASR